MYSVTPLKQDEPYIKWWKSVDGRCVITYVQDPLREIRCYHLTAPDQDTLAPHVAIIRKGIPTYDGREIEALRASARTPAEKVVAVYTTAASAAPPRDPTIIDFLTRALTDRDTAVRRAAVDAVLVVLWPNLLNPLKQVAAADPDAEL